ncbi:MAG: LamG domain-containing protein [Candidatus Omnitrophica bacterium]|nr:LamG domain-containing protein [Candidatus Omnitrophota bacterium]
MRGYEMYYYNETVVFMLYTGQYGQYVLREITTDTSLDDLNWHFIMGTYDGVNYPSSPTGLKIYIDGTERSTVINSNTLNNQDIRGTDPFEIGSNNAGGRWSWDDSIDEVSVWSSALTSAQITHLYNEGLIGGHPRFQPGRI